MYLSRAIFSRQYIDFLQRGEIQFGATEWRRRICKVSGTKREAGEYVNENWTKDGEGDSIELVIEETVAFDLGSKDGRYDAAQCVLVLLNNLEEIWGPMALDSAASTSGVLS